jgi:translation initiation factor 1 (eIF-1/SUI1)
MINNPFENEKININNFENLLIEIWVEQFGKKKNTYISGWNLNENELKEHIKIFKRKHGCNGTLKINNDNIKVIMFQGEHINHIINYLKNLEININNINIKGIINQ